MKKRGAEIFKERRKHQTEKGCDEERGGKEREKEIARIFL